jgi:hypothetical protein
VQAAAAGLTVREIPVRLIYNDPTRSFGGPLDHAESRLEHYRATFRRELIHCAGALAARGLNCGAAAGEDACTCGSGLCR